MLFVGSSSNATDPRATKEEFFAAELSLCFQVLLY